MKKCYLCSKDAGEQYCFYCYRPICDEHTKWTARGGTGRLAYCPLDNKEFYKPLFDFLNSLEKYASDNKIDKKQVLLSVIEQAINKLA